MRISHDLHPAPYVFRTKKEEERMEFDVNRFDEYREDNRLEAKKAKDMTMFIMYRLVMTG